MTTDVIEPFALIKEFMLIDVKKRTEKHGDDDVNAYDAYLEGDFANAVLLKFHPALRDAFYMPARQQDIENDFFPDLKFQMLGPTVSWGLEKSRMNLIVHDVNDSLHDLVLKKKDMDKVKLTMKQGGTVHMSLRVIIGHQVEEVDLLKLLRIDHQKTMITLEQAPIEDEPDNFAQADLLGKEPMSDARAEAERQFAAGLPVGHDIIQTLAAEPPPDEAAIDAVAQQWAAEDAAPKRRSKKAE